jgi:hypothetical protein
VQDGLADVGSQWVILFAALLRAADVKDATFPIHIIQRERNNFTSTQSVHGKQKQYGAIADILRYVGSGAGYEPTNVFPLWSNRKILLCEQSWAAYCVCQSQGTTSLYGQALKERPQCICRGGHRYSAPTLLTF